MSESITTERMQLYARRCRGRTPENLQRRKPNWWKLRGRHASRRVGFNNFSRFSPKTSGGAATTAENRMLDTKQLPKIYCISVQIQTVIGGASDNPVGALSQVQR